MILGNVNTHLKILENERADGVNWKIMMGGLRIEGMLLLNADKICRGKYT